MIYGASLRYAASYATADALLAAAAPPLRRSPVNTTANRFTLLPIARARRYSSQETLVKAIVRHRPRGNLCVAVTTTKIIAGLSSRRSCHARNIKLLVRRNHANALVLEAGLAVRGERGVTPAGWRH